MWTPQKELTVAEQLYNAASNQQICRSMFEFETVLAFGVGASLVALAPMVRRMGNHQLGDSMSNVGKTMAKGGIKVGVTVAGVAGTAARNVARSAAEAAESFVDLVAEARSEMDDTAAAPDAATNKDTTITKVSVD
jgi:hypothetical protein